MNHDAQIIEDMRTPGFRLHALKGDRKGYWAVTGQGAGRKPADIAQVKRRENQIQVSRYRPQPAA